jgi:4-alpha-glucanotransferase
VLLFESSTPQAYHFRFNIHSTASFKQLDARTQHLLSELYVDYFFVRQDQAWEKEALQKLPILKRSTNMLICGEDLGLVPSCVPQVMQSLGMLSLEVQRMPKANHKTFFHPNDAPYLSVVTPSSHDTSTIRGWWEEDRELTQQFYNNEIGQWGEAPIFCEPWINKAILLQHLYSPAMWAIFQLQDYMGVDDAIRRNNPHDERINVPANPKHYWRYRMHISLEELLQEKNFNQEWYNAIKASGR